MTQETIEIIASGITDFEGLRLALRLRKSDLRLNNRELDDIAGLQDGYAAKILCGMKRPGDMSLPSILGALGCELALVHSRAKHQEKENISINCVKKLKKVMSERGARGGRVRKARLSAKKRRSIARVAARKRWDKAKEKKAAPIEAPFS